MFTTLLVLWIAVAVVQIAPKLLPRYEIHPPTPPKPKASLVHLFSGPNDGEIVKVPYDKTELPPHFIAPYVPRDENGMPDPEEANIVHAGNGMAYVKPSFAYYQQVTEEDYIYVRDIDEGELQKLQMTGELSVFKKGDDD